MLTDAEATKNGISNAFSQIESIIQPDDIFYFYYSGHGGAEITTGSASSFHIQYCGISQRQIPRVRICNPLVLQFFWFHLQRIEIIQII